MDRTPKITSVFRAQKNRRSSAKSSKYSPVAEVVAKSPPKAERRKRRSGNESPASKRRLSLGAAVASQCSQQTAFAVEEMELSTQQQAGFAMSDVRAFLRNIPRRDSEVEKPDAFSDCILCIPKTPESNPAKAVPPQTNDHDVFDWLDRPKPGESTKTAQCQQSERRPVIDEDSGLGCSDREDDLFDDDDVFNTSSVLNMLSQWEPRAAEPNPIITEKHPKVTEARSPTPSIEILNDSFDIIMSQIPAYVPAEESHNTPTHCVAQDSETESKDSRFMDLNLADKYRFANGSQNSLHTDHGPANRRLNPFPSAAKRALSSSQERLEKAKRKQLQFQNRMRAQELRRARSRHLGSGASQTCDNFLPFPVFSLH